MRRSAWPVLALVLLATACGVTPGAMPPGRAAQITALVGGGLQPSPDAAPIPDGVVVITGAPSSGVATISVPRGGFPRSETMGPRHPAGHIASARGTTAAGLRATPCIALGQTNKVALSPQDHTTIVSDG